MQLASLTLLAAKTIGKRSVLGANRPDRSPQEFLILSQGNRHKVSMACHSSLNWQLHSACAAARFVFLAPHCIQKRSLVAPGFPGRICTLLAVIPQPSYLCLSFSVSHFSLATLSRKPESLFNPLATNSSGDRSR